MLVNILQTFDDANGKRRYAGENPDVDPVIARRWIADGYAAENLSLIRSVVLAAVKQHVEASVKAGKRKLSLAMTQKVCGWDQDTLLEVARGLFSA